MIKYVVFFLFAGSMTMSGQQVTFEDWNIESQNNIRLLPKYGGVSKTEMQKEADAYFIQETMKSFKTKNEASNHLVKLGFKYLNKGDLKTAMYRFNQAYLLDESNAGVYWGYGSIYMSYREFHLARRQYKEGLDLDQDNVQLTIDYGTTYLGEYYKYLESDPDKAKTCLNNAVDNLLKAYAMEPTNADASFKLSVCYHNKNNCVKAIEYLEISENLGNSNITDSYRSEVYLNCRTATLECSDFKTGKFEIQDQQTGSTLIERTANFQIEENKKLGYRIKFKITWISDCVYQLQPIEDLLDPQNNELSEVIVTCSITKKTDQGYIQVSSSDVSSLKLTSEMIRLE